MKKNIVLAIIVAAVVFVCGLALVSPLKYSSEYVIDNLDSCKAITADSIVFTNNCTVDENNNVSITGGDAFIILATEEIPSESFALQFSNMHNNGADAQLFYADDGGSFTEVDSVHSTLIDGKIAVFDVLENDSSYFRLDIDTDYTFGAIYASESDFQKAYTPNGPAALAVVLVAAVSLAAAVGLTFLFTKLSLAEKIIKYIREHYKNFFTYCGYMAAALFITAAATVVFKLTRNKAIFTAITLMLVAHAVYFRKTVYKNMPVFTAVCIIFFGILFIFTSPFAHISWDTESHYEWAINGSYIGDAYYCKADEDIINMSGDFMYYGKDENNGKVIQKYNTDSNVATKTVFEKSTKLSSLPSGIFIALGRLFNRSFYERYCMGKLANLLCYALICYFAIKKVQSGRVIMSIIALFPTNLLLASNYAYDWWVTSFIMLGVACFVNECQQPDKPITFKDTVIMCGAIALGCLPKLIYMPFLVLPFFVKKNNFKNRKKYYALCASVIVVLFAALLARSLFIAKGGGDMRGGSTISIKGQALYILHNPIAYTKTLVKFLLEYLSVESMCYYITLLSYLGQGSYAGVIIAVFIVAIITDKDVCDVKASSWLIRTVSVVLYLGIGALIATALYLDFTPVGYNTVLGCQPRYIVPLLYPLVALLPCGVSKLKINKNIYALGLIVPCALVVLQNIFQLVI